MKEERYKICNERILWRSIDKEVVILDLDSDNYYSLNEAGSMIWEALGKGNSVSKTALMLSEMYGIDIKTAEKDLNDILVKLKKDNLIIRK